MFDYQSLMLPYIKDISSNWKHQSFPWYEEQFLQALAKTGISQIHIVLLGQILGS